MSAPDTPLLPPHPGPRPDPFVFPFAEARAAQLAMEDLADDLTHLAAVHEREAADARRAWQGTTAFDFDRALAELLWRLRHCIAVLLAQADAVAATSAQARTRLEASEQEQRRWQRRLLVHQQAREARGASAAGAHHRREAPAPQRP